MELPLIWTDPSSWGRRGVPAHNITVNIGTSCITRQMVLILSTFPELSGHYWDIQNSLSRNTGHWDQFSVFMVAYLFKLISDTLFLIVDY